MSKYLKTWPNHFLTFKPLPNQNCALILKRNTIRFIGARSRAEAERVTGPARTAAIYYVK